MLSMPRSRLEHTFPAQPPYRSWTRVTLWPEPSSISAHTKQLAPNIFQPSLNENRKNYLVAVKVVFILKIMCLELDDYNWHHTSP